MKVLWRPDLAHWRPLILLALAMTVAAKGLSVSAPLMFGEAVNRVDEGSGPGALSAFVWALLLYGAGRLGAAALPQLRDAFFVSVTQDANRAIAVEAYAHAQHLSLQFHVTRRAGALQRIIERGAGAMEYLLRFLAFNIGPTIIELILAAAVLAAYGIEFSLTAVITVVTFAVFTVAVTEWRTRQRRIVNEADTELRAASVDSLTNFETVKAFAQEERETERFDGAMRVFNRHYVRLMRSLSWLNIGQETIMNAGLLVMVFFAGRAVLQGDAKIGDLTAVMLIMLNLYRPLNVLGWAWREIKQGVVDMEKLFGLFAVPPTVADAPDAGDLKSTGGAVSFRDVSFAYEGRASGLRGVDFDIPAGAFVGLAGPSGAGKSTILKLLYRFYDPAAGRVLIDEQDLTTVTQRSVRNVLGLVPQEVVLFNDTLGFNISYARPDATPDEMNDALARAQLSDFVASLPDGLATRVGERGLKLSGGEKQRVGVARAILRDPRILILDEATSSLDSETEREVQAALAEAARGRTTLAVAHRLSTIAAADLILVFDDGRIVERGTHEALIAAGGLYARMWARQLIEPAPAATEPAE